MSELTTILEPLTYSQVVQQMSDIYLASLETSRPVMAEDLLEGSELRCIFEAVGAPLEELFYRMAVILPQQLYLDQATGDALDRLVANFTFGQVVRAPASTAGGPIVYVGAAGAVVTDGVQMKTGDAVQVKNVGLTSIPVGDTQATGVGLAVVAGASGNLAAGTELIFINNPPGVTRAYVPTNWTGGADVQSDESLRQAVLEFLDSLAKGTRDAITFGSRQSGYDRIVIIEPATGRCDVYLDDGAGANTAKLAAARLNLHRNWKAAGVRLRTFGPVQHPVTLVAEAFTDGTVLLADLQAGIAQAWAQLFANKRMGDGLTRLELVAAAATVPGYNGVNLESPTANLTVKAATDEYWTEWDDGDLYPYEILTLAGVTWG